MSSDGRVVASTTWTDRAGREVRVVEDSPGVVHITTEALAELLRLAGWTEQLEPIRSVAVQGTTGVLRDERGRCQECGTPPEQEHRRDCPHATPRQRARLIREAPGTSYELRPGADGAEAR